MKVFIIHIETVTKGERQLYQARVEHDGVTVQTTEPDPAPEVAWEDAARWCRRRSFSGGFVEGEIRKDESPG